MNFGETQAGAAWLAADLRNDQRWIFQLDDRARRHLTQAVAKAFDPAKGLFDYRRGDLDLGPALPVIRAAFNEARKGRGVALIRGLPRENMTEDAFRLLSWALGLHTGVARPQGKASQYMSAVRDIGTNYR